MAKWKEFEDDDSPFGIAKSYTKAWEKETFEFSKEQVAYMNGEVLQKLMNMTPGYEEKYKRAIYEYVIAQLADYSVHCYWEIKHRQKVGH